MFGELTSYTYQEKPASSLILHEDQQQEAGPPVLQKLTRQQAHLV